MNLDLALERTRESTGPPYLIGEGLGLPTVMEPVASTQSEGNLNTEPSVSSSSHPHDKLGLCGQ